MNASRQKEILEAIQREEQALRNQKNAYEEELMTREKIDQEMLKQAYENKNHIEETIFAEIDALKEKNVRFQEKCHNERKQFGLKIWKTVEENNADVLNEMQRTNEIKLGNQQNKVDRELRMHALEQWTPETKVYVGNELKKDRKEAVFIVAVKRIVSAGQDLTDEVDSLADHTFELTTGCKRSALESDIGLCEHIVSMIISKIAELQDRCLEISIFCTTDHTMVKPVQKNAEEIGKSAREILMHLERFQVSLSDDPNTNSIKLFESVQTKNDRLKRMIKLIPDVTETNYAVTYLKKRIENGMDL